MPKKPSKAFIDADVMLFQAASKGEQVWYIYYDKSGDEVARFSSAKEGDEWLVEKDLFGFDLKFGCEEDSEFLKKSRKQHFEDLGFEKCQEAWGSSVKYLEKDLLSFNKDMEFQYYISAATGLRNFRYDLATIAKYKDNRNETRKPKYLEELRTWCIKQDNVKAPKIKFEIDDMVNALAKKYGEDGLVVSYDKDCQGISGAWYYMPSDYDEPAYSSSKVVGKLFYDETSKKVSGCGTLFWLWQCMASDTADNIKGCKGIGKKKAYDILKDYSEKPVSYLPEVLAVVGRVFKKAYGDEYTYKHCYTEEEMKVGWYEVFKENLGLVMMLANQNDSVEKSILKFLNKEYVDEPNGESTSNKEIP